MTTTIKTAKQAMAAHFGWDIADLREYEYQEDRYSRTIYGLTDGYYCAVKNKKQLPKDERFNWAEELDQFINQSGWLIFKSL